MIISDVCKVNFASGEHLIVLQREANQYGIYPNDNITAINIIYGPTGKPQQFMFGDKDGIVEIFNYDGNLNEYIRLAR